jgi:uncharacterized protein (TIGR03435 family)
MDCQAGSLKRGFEITAKAEGDGALTLEQFRQMLRTLMAERFQLKIHSVTEEIPVYLLVVDKNGHKFQASAAGTQGTRKESKGQFEATRYDMESLARWLRREVDRRVVDRTGLTGSYGLKLEWAPAGAESGGGPSIFTALQTQLGLRLEFRKKYPVEVLIVDHAEKPEEN